MANLKEKYHKLGKDTLFISIGNFASKMLTFLMVPFYTMFLSIYDYGVVELIITLSSLLMPVLSLDIAEATWRFLLDRDNEKQAVFRCGILSVLICTFLTMLVIPFLKLSIDLYPYRFYFLTYLLSLVIYNMLSAYMKGTEQLFVFSSASILASLCCVFFSLLLIMFYDGGIVGYLLSFILSYIVASIYILLKGNRKYLDGIFKINYYKDRLLFFNMAKYSLPMIPNSISWWISNSSDKFILNSFYDASVVGVYSIAYKIPSIMSVICNTFISAWQLSSVDGFGQKDTTDFFNSVYRKFMLVLVFLASTIILFIKMMAAIMFSNEFYIAWRYVPVLLIGILFCSGGTFLGSVFTASKKTQFLFYSTLLGAIVNIGLNIIFIPQYGAMGAAIATVISYILVWAYRMFKVQQIIQIRFSFLGDVGLYILILLESLAIYAESIYGYVVAGIIFCLIGMILVRQLLLTKKELINRNNKIKGM